MAHQPERTERKPTGTIQDVPHRRGGPSTPIDNNCTLEEAAKTIVNLYHQIAPQDNKDDFFSLKDFKEFMQLQAPLFLGACGRDRPGYLEELFKKLDVDKDGQLTFDEFAPVIGMVVDDAHRMGHGDDRCGPEKE